MLGGAAWWALRFAALLRLAGRDAGKLSQLAFSLSKLNGNIPLKCA